MILRPQPVQPSETNLDPFLAPNGMPWFTVGLDIGGRVTRYCILDCFGAVYRKGKIETSPAELRRFARELKQSRIILEACPQASWMHDLLLFFKHEVIVGNPRDIKVISDTHHKSDRRDAELLARLGRADIELLHPIKVRGAEARRGRSLLRARESLVETRTKLINAVRGICRSNGVRIEGPGTSLTFHRRAAEQLPTEVLNIVNGVLSTIAMVTDEIKLYERQLEELASTAYPEEMALLCQVPGVGLLTGLSYLLCIEDPARFKKSRDVGPFLGLVPGRRQTGDSDPQLRITKRGDRNLRRLLVQAAHYTLHLAPDSELKRFGKEMAQRGGKITKMKAVIAVARKLAVLLHRLWVNGAVYDPFFNTPSQAS